MLPVSMLRQNSPTNTRVCTCTLQVHGMVFVVDLLITADLMGVLFVWMLHDPAGAWHGVCGGCCSSQPL